MRSEHTDETSLGVYSKSLRVGQLVGVLWGTLGTLEQGPMVGYIEGSGDGGNGALWANENRASRCIGAEGIELDAGFFGRADAGGI